MSPSLTVLKLSVSSRFMHLISRWMTPRVCKCNKPMQICQAKLHKSRSAKYSLFLSCFSSSYAQKEKSLQVRSENNSHVVTKKRIKQFRTFLNSVHKSPTSLPFLYEGFLLEGSSLTYALHISALGKLNHDVDALALPVAVLLRIGVLFRFLA